MGRRRTIEAPKSEPSRGDRIDSTFGLMVEAEEQYTRASYEVDRNPKAVLEAARKLNAARMAWLKAKGAIPE